MREGELYINESISIDIIIIITQHTIGEGEREGGVAINNQSRIIKDTHTHTHTCMQEEGTYNPLQTKQTTKNWELQMWNNNNNW